MDSDTTKIVREGLERACKDFSYRVSALGFQRTKKMFWTRRNNLTVDVIHFHRSGSSSGSPINYSVDLRVHFAIRVLNDSSEAIALNGPLSDPARVRECRYHLRFNAKSNHMYERCLDDLLRFTEEQGEPWFIKWRDTSTLATDVDSPLTTVARECLVSAQRNMVDADYVRGSSKLLGLS